MPYKINAITGNLDLVNLAAVSPTGSGNVTASGTSTKNNFVFYGDTTGKLITDNNYSSASFLPNTTGSLIGSNIVVNTSGTILASTTISIPQSVATNATVTFNTVTASNLNGNTVNATTITAVIIACTYLTATNGAGGTPATSSLIGSNIVVSSSGGVLSSLTISIPQSVATNANVTFSTVTATSLGSLNISTTNLQAVSVTATSLGSLNISSTNIQASSLTATSLGSLNISTTNLSASTLTATNLGGVNIASATATHTTLSGTTVTVTSLGSLNISSTNIQATSVTATSLGSLNISSTNIQAVSVTATSLGSLNISTTNLQATLITATGIGAVGVTASVIQSTVATGTAPFIVASTNSSTNLNADLLDGVHLNGIFSGGGLSWSVLTAPTTLGNGGYLINSSGNLTCTLPSISGVGGVVMLSGLGVGGWTLKQWASQQIHFGNLDSTSGTGGSLASTNTRDSIELVCCVLNSEFNIVSAQGNITVA